MSTKHPWYKPYERLLKHLQQRYGGEIIQPSEELQSAFAGEDYVGHHSPTPRFSAEGTSYFIELSRQYNLYLFAIGHTKANFRIHQRGFVDNMQAFLGVGGEVRSHNPVFDHLFASDTDAKDPSGLLQSAEVQQLLQSLLPFAFVKFHEGGIELARDIGRDADFDVSTVERAIKTLARLLKIAS